MYEKESAVQSGMASGVEGQYQVAAEASLRWMQTMYLPDNMEQALWDSMKELCEILTAQYSFYYEWKGMGWKLHYEWDCAAQYMSQGEKETGEDQKRKEAVWLGCKPVLPGQPEILEEICPSFASVLRSAGRELSHTAAIPVWDKGTLVGCLGVCNPEPQWQPVISILLESLSTIVVVAQRMHTEHKELEFLHLYDGLTGAYHRGTYLKELTAAQPEQVFLGIIRLQIIDVKRINECYGYTYGDDLLIRCIKRISDLLKDKGDLYRVGCNEFAIICKGLEQAEFENLANQLSPDIEENFHCTAAIGYQWTNRTRTIQRLDLAAESMMEEDRKRYIRLQSLMDRQCVSGDDLHGMLTLDGITTLLDEGRFLVYLQPKLSFADSTLVGAEALVRFQDAEGGILEPGDFVPDLESTMLIRFIDLFVFEQACHMIYNWQSSSLERWIPISVNFSRITLEEPNLIAKLIHLCRRYDVAPGCLEIEIAGGLNRQLTGNLEKVVERIHEAGFVVTMDNFGIRFSNLSLLIALDCDKLKVDRRMVENIATSAKAQTVLRALADLCSSTGTKTTVAGVETKAQLAILKHMGFDEVQGYLISPPITHDEFAAKYLYERCINE